MRMTCDSHTNPDSPITISYDSDSNPDSTGADSDSDSDSKVYQTP